MRILRSALLLALAFCALAAQADVFLGTMHGRNFYLTDAAAFATDQIAYAQSMGGVLASIHSQTEMDFLHNATASYDFVWIGFTDDPAYGASEGDFRWLDGSAVDYTFWTLPSEPNNDGDGENFTIMNWGDNGSWNDRPNENLSRALYTTAVPGPMAALPFALMALKRRKRA